MYRAHERAGIGYNSRKLFGGFDISMVQSVRERNGTAVQLNAARTYFQFFIGYRFVVPAFVKTNILVIEDQLPVK